MKILITNDDGISAVGLHTLKNELRKMHEVWVIAPDGNRSGVSHGITMTVPLALKKIAENEYSYGGLPADCVLAALTGFLPFIPDVVVSGINRGANLGTDTIYSGTVGAARQAVLFGVPGIAVSLAAEEFSEDHGTWKYDALARFIAANVEKLSTAASRGLFVNVNAGSADSYKGACCTVLSRRQYNDLVRIENTPDSRCYGFFVGGQISASTEPRNTPSDGIYIDDAAVRNGYISVSYVYAHPESYIPEAVSESFFQLS